MARPRIGIVIPAFNEAATITDVVRAVQSYGVPIVVDDGSTDETASLAKCSGAVMVSHAKNSGYDGALNSGFIKAAEIGCEIVITVDADGQHDPTLVQKFINAIDAGADIVVGIRSRKQRLVEHIFAVYTSLRFGIKDPLCGMKGYKLDRFRNAGPFNQYKSIGTRYAIIAGSSRFIVRQIPVSVRPRIDAPRFASGWLGNFVILKAMLLGLFLARSVRT